MNRRSSNVRLFSAGHKTSVSLEDEFWKGLKEIADKRLVNLSTLVDTIDAQRQQGNLSSAVRLFVLEYYRSQIPEVEGREGFSRADGIVPSPSFLADMACGLGCNTDGRPGQLRAVFSCCATVERHPRIINSSEPPCLNHLLHRCDTT